jgi:hypothetical protein
MVLISINKDQRIKSCQNHWTHERDEESRYLDVIIYKMQDMMIRMLLILQNGSKVEEVVKKRV